MIIDLHSHTTLSDGELTPLRLLQRAKELHYKVLAITDHANEENLESIIGEVVKECESFNSQNKGEFPIALPGIELTQVLPRELPRYIAYARELGAKIVGVHGETIVEKIPSGTNRAAILGKADFLAHPGLISEEDVMLATKEKVFLEITSRKGHSLCNGYIVKMAQKYKTPLLFNSDTHLGSDLYFLEKYLKTPLGAGLTKEEFQEHYKSIISFLNLKFSLHLQA